MAALKEKPEIRFKLTVLKGPHMGQVFQLNKDIISLGRSSDNAVVLTDDPQISRNHAQLAVINNEVIVSNLSQKNALIVEGSSVQKWKLVNNSQFTIGDSEIKVEYDLGQVVVSVPTNQVANVVPINPAVKTAPQPSASAKKTVAKPKNPQPVANVARPNQSPSVNRPAMPPAAMQSQMMQMQQMNMQRQQMPPPSHP